MATVILSLFVSDYFMKFQIILTKLKVFYHDPLIQQHLFGIGKHDTEMARKLKMEAEKNYYMLKDRQKITEEDLAKSKVKLEKAQREVSSLDQRLGRATEENRLLRKKAGTQVQKR